MQKEARQSDGQLDPAFVEAVKSELFDTRNVWVRISTLGYGKAVAEFGPTARDMHDACWVLVDRGLAIVNAGEIRTK